MVMIVVSGVSRDVESPGEGARGARGGPNFLTSVHDSRPETPTQLTQKEEGQINRRTLN